jgi:ribulose-phosphate 3-epimerase
MIIPGILEETFDQAQTKYNQVASFADIVQLDIADGILVEGKTFLSVEQLIDLTGHAKLQVHLMVQKPESYLATMPTNIKDLCIQIEAFMYRLDYMDGFVDILRTRELRSGLSFNPQTNWQDYEDYLKHFDYIQFMGVEPGAQGRTFDDSVVEKIKAFRKTHPSISIQVDGGVNSQNLIDLVKAGVNSLVVGSQIFSNSKKIDQHYNDFVIEFQHAQQLLHPSS